MKPLFKKTITLLISGLSVLQWLNNGDDYLGNDSLPPTKKICADDFGIELIFFKMALVAVR